MGDSYQEYTIFVALNGTYIFELMPFGLINAFSTFQKIINDVIAEIRFAQAYLDDIFIHSPTMEELMNYLNELFSLISIPRLRMKLTKFEFSKDTVELHGQIFSKDGVLVDSEKVTVIQDAPAPSDQTSP